MNLNSHTKTMEHNFYPISSLSSVIKHQFKQFLAFLAFNRSLSVKSNYIPPSQPSFCRCKETKLRDSVPVWPPHSLGHPWQHFSTLSTSVLCSTRVLSSVFVSNLQTSSQQENFLQSIQDITLHLWCKISPYFYCSLALRQTFFFPTASQWSPPILHLSYLLQSSSASSASGVFYLFSFYVWKTEIRLIFGKLHYQPLLSTLPITICSWSSS